MLDTSMAPTAASENFSAGFLPQLVLDEPSGKRV